MAEKDEPTWREIAEAEGKRKERAKALNSIRALLQDFMEKRFGPLSDQDKECIRAVSDCKRLGKMLTLVNTAPSVSAVLAAGA